MLAELFSCTLSHPLSNPHSLLMLSLPCPSCPPSVIHRLLYILNGREDIEEYVYFLYSWAKVCVLMYVCLPAHEDRDGLCPLPHSPSPIPPLLRAGHALYSCCSELLLMMLFRELVERVWRMSGVGRRDGAGQGVG